MSRIKIAIIAIIAGIILDATVWWFSRPAPAPVNTTRLAQPAPELKGQPMQEINPPKVPVYAPSTKKKLGLPAEVQDDPNKYVLGAAKLPNDTHPHTITTIIDAQTGEVQIYDRRDPLPWLLAEQTGEIRLDYGIKNALATVTRLSVREDLVQVKALHAGINASLDSDGAYFLGAGVGWRW